MKNFYRNSIICNFLILIMISNVIASDRNKDADAVISMRNGNPCFSYPQDEEIKKRAYSFTYLGVSNNNPFGGVQWAIQIASLDRNGLLEPNHTGTCIEYGVTRPGIEDMESAQPLLFNVPYQVHINVHARNNGPTYERKYESNFCLARNEKGENFLVGAEYDGNADAWKCLKPGESPKRSFWQKLFGK